MSKDCKGLSENEIKLLQIIKDLHNANNEVSAENIWTATKDGELTAFYMAVTNAIDYEKAVLRWAQKDRERPETGAEPKNEGSLA